MIKITDVPHGEWIIVYSYYNDTKVIYIDQFDKFQKRRYIGLQSWYVSKNDFRIEIYLEGATILTEYNSLDKWKAVLKIINEQV